jgi:TatD DNase family protein
MPIVQTIPASFFEFQKGKDVVDIKYVDIHSHLHFPDYDADREEVLARMKEKGVATITVGTSLETSRQAVALAEQYPHVFACIGVHPHDAEESFDIDAFEQLVRSPKVVAVGECGLDYGREGVIDEADMQAQKALFETQIDFAVAHDKPLMIHARNSADDILAVLFEKKKQYGEKLRGNAHFFTGNAEEARRYGELDFSTSFTGVLTFTHDYDETVRSVPLASLMSETDAPFVAPVPYRGKRNEPAFVIEVVKKMAELRGVGEEELAQELLKNAVAKWGLVW